jgi:hypothetical protein
MRYRSQAHACNLRRMRTNACERWHHERYERTRDDDLDGCFGDVQYNKVLLCGVSFHHMHVQSNDFRSTAEHEHPFVGQDERNVRRKRIYAGTWAAFASRMSYNDIGKTRLIAVVSDPCCLRTTGSSLPPFLFFASLAMHQVGKPDMGYIYEKLFPSR